MSTIDEKVAKTDHGVGGGRSSKKKWVLPNSRPEVAFVVWSNNDDVLSQAMVKEKNLRVSGL